MNAQWLPAQPEPTLMPTSAAEPPSFSPNVSTAPSVRSAAGSTQLSGVRPPGPGAEEGQLHGGVRRYIEDHQAHRQQRRVRLLSLAAGIANDPVSVLRKLRGAMAASLPATSLLISCERSLRRRGPVSQQPLAEPLTVSVRR
jgi:hypothetical protein